ncbi:hypothetical protein J7E73_05480 [Paenibacillus albidus]|uniref:hypothetical protein n=1 Tax=Paenibacillus albidus TaxID=2041023 RepID=UPI001BE913F3|nr:hypothetical protein [Paenibacillus albidus]MBT2288594.1 hypothetical protein [Paenibacillus albidus]
MNRAWWIGAAALMAAASAAVLPKLADLDAAVRQQYGTVEVFTDGSYTVLEDDNLVDALGAYPFTLAIGSAGWKNGVLSLDLKVTGNDHEPAELYRNMAGAISFAFEETDNVNQLLLRLVADDKWLGTRRLLLAADIRRGEWTKTLQEELAAAGNVRLPERLKTRFRISESELWINQFISP